MDRLFPRRAPRRTLALWGLLALSLSLSNVATVRGDAPPPPRSRHPSLALSGVTLVRTDAPERDAGAAVDDVRRSLARSARHLEGCLAATDLREDPLRVRARTLRGTLTFRRARRPEVAIGASSLPTTARACVEEVAHSVALRTAPRGTVTVRFAYQLY